MANLRGATNLWSNISVGSNGTSNPASVGSATSVCVFISNTGGSSTTITVQASGGGTPSAGENADLTGSTWFDYDRGEAGTNTLTVASGANIAFDLSPFAPPYIRLKSSAATTLTAFVVANG